jgi:glycosyltransferase involved in cell wall biosynthesis
MNTPLITVLMPAYNAEKYIGEAIASVLDQTLADLELLVINDGSTDDTENIINSFTDPRIRLINQTNQGIASALNIGLLNARAEIIARFDADDVCMPDRLQRQYDFLSNNPDHIIVGSNARYIDMYDEYVYTGRMLAYTDEEIRKLIFITCPLIHSATMFWKKPVLLAGSYNTHAYAFEDHLLWSKLLKHGKAFNLAETLIKVRLSPGSVSIDEKWRTKRFREIKSDAIRSGDISEEEGKELLGILHEQDNSKIKEGSYYALLGKKYLWDNHQPAKARMNLKKTIRIHPGRLDSYAIMLLSFFPKSFIDWMYQKKIAKL